MGTKRKRNTKPTSTEWNDVTPDAGYVKTKTALAEALGVTRQSIVRWSKELGWPGKRPDGTYSVADIVLWKSGREMKADDASPALERWRLARAKAAELDLAEREGEVLPKDEVEAAWVKKVETIKRRLLSLVRELPPQLEGLDKLEMREVLKARIEEICREYAHD